MTDCPKLTAYALFVRPRGFAPGWEKTALWQRTAIIPGVIPVTDVEGQLAAKFGARTSGETVLYDSHGRLVFQGGITGSRGHEGDNLGLSIVEGLANGRENLLPQGKEQNQSAVFGCSLGDLPTPTPRDNALCLK